MRIVRGKEKQLGTALLDYPTDRLGRMGRELELAANVIRRFQWQSQARLRARESLLRDVEPPR
jgi:hypothetical protein